MILCTFVWANGYRTFTTDHTLYNVYLPLWGRRDFCLSLSSPIVLNLAPARGDEKCMNAMLSICRCVYFCEEIARNQSALYCAPDENSAVISMNIPSSHGHSKKKLEQPPYLSTTPKSCNPIQRVPCSPTTGNQTNATSKRNTVSLWNWWATPIHTATLSVLMLNPGRFSARSHGLCQPLLDFYYLPSL